MAIYGYYFNANKNGDVYDRTYNAEDMCSYLKSLVSNGVFGNVSTSLQVMANSGMNVLVKAGSGFIEGHKIIVDADYSLTIDTADTSLNRIDRIVVAMNRTDRVMQIYIKKGTMASNPVAPTLQRDENIYEISLATITVNKNVTTITQSMIRDDRGDETVCGFVHALIEQADMSTIYNQFDTMLDEKETTFDEWFDNLQETLVSNTVFIEKKAVYTTVSANTTTINIPSSLLYGDDLDVLHVYINGFRLIETIDYTKTTTTITFTPAISKSGTVIEITNWKTLGASGSDIQTVVGAVTQLQSDVSELESKTDDILTYEYYCTGTNDNQTISYLMGNFYDGTGKFVGVNSQAQLRLKVYGTLVLDNNSPTVTTTNCKGFIAVEKSSNKKVVLDLSNASIVVTLTTNKSMNAIIDVSSSNISIINPKINAVLSGNILSIIRTNGNVDGGYITCTNNDAKSITGIKCISTSEDQTISNTYFWLNATSTSSAANNLVGFNSRETETENEMPVKFINCTARMTGATNTYYTIRGFKGFGIFDNCFAYGYSTSQSEYAVVYGFDGGGRYTNCTSTVTGNRITRGFSGKGTYTNCKTHAASSTTQASACVGFRVVGEIIGCEAIGRNAGNGSGYGILFNDEDGTTLKIVNTKAYGYCASNQASVATVFAHGISVSSNTAFSISCIGCECPISARQYMTQKGSILLQGTTTGADGALIGNMVGSAIIKHSGSNVTEVGTIVL